LCVFAFFLFLTIPCPSRFPFFLFLFFFFIFVCLLTLSVWFFCLGPLSFCFLFFFFAFFFFFFVFFFFFFSFFVLFFSFFSQFFLPHIDSSFQCLLSLFGFCFFFYFFDCYLWFFFFSPVTCLVFFSFRFFFLVVLFFCFFFFCFFCFFVFFFFSFLPFLWFFLFGFSILFCFLFWSFLWWFFGIALGGLSPIFFFVCGFVWVAVLVPLNFVSAGRAFVLWVGWGVVVYCVVVSLFFLLFVFLFFFFFFFVFKQNNMVWLGLSDVRLVVVRVLDDWVVCFLLFVYSVCFRNRFSSVLFLMWSRHWRGPWWWGRVAPFVSYRDVVLDGWMCSLCIGVLFLLWLSAGALYLWRDWVNFLGRLILNSDCIQFIEIRFLLSWFFDQSTYLICLRGSSLVTGSGGRESSLVLRCVSAFIRMWDCVVPRSLLRPADQGGIPPGSMKLGRYSVVVIRQTCTVWGDSRYLVCVALVHL